MKTLIVHAHPAPHSLTSALKDVAVSTLRQDGHEVQVSDLYAMDWKPIVDAADFGAAASSPLRVVADSGRAYETGALSADIAAEQAKLLWADTVILQFPLWWYSMPAIMKGWVDRVFTYGFGYGVGEHNDTRYGDRLGEGILMGKRALLAVTIGGREPHYSDRGVNGPIEDLLFPIQHGILFYTGMQVLPPFVMYSTMNLSPEDFTDASKAWEQRVRSIEETDPIAYRSQNGGEYEIPSLRLHTGLESPGSKGFGLHIK